MLHFVKSFGSILLLFIVFELDVWVYCSGFDSCDFDHYIIYVSMRYAFMLAVEHGIVSEIWLSH